MGYQWFQQIKYCFFFKDDCGIEYIVDLKERGKTEERG